ncbi:restriction endonuclease subunit S [Butyrivibrio sp. AE3003]|uniref:restriction endonuclease subunit S n=1 Tax=Butyrivibrio sp. AE3003 TaxID=1496721 RepID=UPI0004794CED|nr:restriction endonuclease subunit S [Butyrivibrio sp. AE3003]
MINRQPQIRFLGLNDDWEQRKLLDCIQKITDFRGRTPKKLGMDWSEEGYLALSALNVKDGYIDFNQDVHYGNQELYDKWMTGNELHKGQVLFTTEAPMGNVAQVPDNQRYILSQRTIAFDVKDNLITENFLATVLRTPTVFADLTALSSGGTAKGVSQKSLASVEIRLPKNLKEQEKISDTFSNIDNLITLHQRKCDKLINIKKSMLEKMFPQKGEKTPEIRFSGFTDDWEQRKLSEIATMHARIGWQNLRTSEFLDQGNYMLITGTDFDDGKINYATCHYVEKERYDQDPHIQISNGSILITKDGTLGKVAYVQGLKLPATLNAGVFNVEIRDKNSVDGKYLFQYLKAPFLMDYVGQKATGGTIKHLNQNILVDFPVVLPEKAEQEKIGRYLEGIDNLITLNQRKLEKLIIIKKSMLEKMFV